MDGVSSPQANVDRAAELGMSGLAITDHGTAAGLYDHYDACHKKGIVPVLGNELYWKEDIGAPWRWKSVENEELRERLKEEDKSRKYFHGCFYATSFVGYQNLLRLSSMGFDEGRYQHGRPVVSKEDIFNHSEGLAFNTGCMIGLVGVAQKRPLDIVESRRLMGEFHEVFRDRMFVEIGPAQVCMDWDNKESVFKPRVDGCLQQQHNHRALALAREFDIPVIVASDGHMARPDLKPLQDMLITSVTGGWHFHQTHSILSSDETWDLIEKYHPYIGMKDFESYIDNTFRLTALARGLRLKFAPLISVAQMKHHPLWEEGLSSREFLFKIVRHMKRIPDDPVYISRLIREIDVIANNGVTDYTDYFLMLHDLVRAAQERGEGVGAGRGSAAGCLLAYALGITEVDPIRYGLLFERFLNPGRLGVPNISFAEYPFERWLKEQKSDK